MEPGLVWGLAQGLALVQVRVLEKAKARVLGRAQALAVRAVRTAAAMSQVVAVARVTAAG